MSSTRGKRKTWSPIRPTVASPAPAPRTVQSSSGSANPPEDVSQGDEESTATSSPQDPQPKEPPPVEKSRDPENGNEGNKQTQRRSRRNTNANYKSPAICCCDLQSALVCMAVIDMILAFIFFVMFISSLSGPPRRHVEPEPEPHGHGHHGFYHHHHHRVWRWRRAIPDEPISTTPTSTTTATVSSSTPSSEESSGRLFYGLGLGASLFILIASIFLLCGAIGRTKAMSWIGTIIGSLVFIAAASLYCVYVFGNSDAAGSAPFLVCIALALCYRIYETVVVYYFVKEPPPEPIRYVMTDGDGQVAYIQSSPQVMYVPAGGYYGGPYYGGYYGPGYGPGYGVATGVGLGMALGAGFHDHDHYDFHDDYY